MTRSSFVSGSLAGSIVGAEGAFPATLMVQRILLQSSFEPRLVEQDHSS